MAHLTQYAGHQAEEVSIGNAVVAFMRSIENFEVTFRQDRRRVKSR